MRTHTLQCILAIIVSLLFGSHAASGGQRTFEVYNVRIGSAIKAKKIYDDIKKDSDLNKVYLYVKSKSRGSTRKNHIMFVASTGF